MNLKKKDEGERATQISYSNEQPKNKIGEAVIQKKAWMILSLAREVLSFNRGLQVVVTRSRGPDPTQTVTILTLNHIALWTSAFTTFWASRQSL